MELLNTVLDALLGGGLLVTMVTLRSMRKKATAEATGSELENEEKASHILMDYIVEPLKKEIDGLRKDVRRLQKAIDKISDCSHADNCPVRHELQDCQDRNRHEAERGGGNDH